MSRSRHSIRWAVAAAVTALATVTLTSSPAQARTTPTHVAVVVTYNGQSTAACVPSGLDGLTTLAHGYSVESGSGPYAGFVVSINGNGTPRPDDTHYWSYWHKSATGWTYSSVGAGSYHPAAGSVDGWSYVDGQSTPPPPGEGTYSSICKGDDPAATTLPAPAQAHESSGSGIPPWGTALAIVVVLALGGVAYWRTRVRRRNVS